MEQTPRRKLDFIFDRTIRPDLSPIITAFTLLLETVEQGVGGLEMMWEKTLVVFPEGSLDNPNFQELQERIVFELINHGSSTTLDRAYAAILLSR